MAETYANRVKRADQYLERTRECAEEAREHMAAAKSASEDARGDASRTSELLKAAQQSSEDAQAAAVRANESQAIYMDACEQQLEAQRAYAVARENAERSTATSNQARSDADEAERASAAVIATHEKIRTLLTKTTATEISESFTRDGKMTLSRALVDGLHWVALAAVVAAILTLHMSSMDFGDGLAHVAGTVPLWLIVALIARSLHDRRMVRQECIRTARVITSVIGFKDEFGENALTENIQENTPLAKMLEAIERNPAQRMKAGADGVTGVLNALFTRKKEGDGPQ